MKLRQKLLMDKIMQSGTVSFDDLSRLFFVGEKTIRNDIKQINEYVSSREGRPCFSIFRRTVSFCGDSGMKQALDGCSVSDDYYLYHLSGEERFFIIIAKLICSSDYMTIEEFSNQLCVSRSTVNSDMLHIKEWCRKNSIRIELKKSRGIRLDEGEEKKRKILSKLISDHVHVGGLGNTFYEAVLSQKIFHGINESAIKEIILSAEEKYKFIFSDEAFEELVVQIAFSILQDKTSHPAFKDDRPDIRPDRMEYQVIRYIVDRTNFCFHTQISENVIPCLAELSLKRASQPEKSPMQDEEAELPYIQIIAEQLILNVGKNIHFDFSTNEVLYSRLVVHLCSAIFSMRNEIRRDDPFSRSLIEENKSLSCAIRASCNCLSQFFGREVSNEGICHLLIYFASAVENSSKTFPARIPVVAVLCNTGQGTAQLVVEELKRYFNFDIKSVMAVHQLEYCQKKQKFDFVISTIPLKTVLPCVVVSPIIRRDDIENITEMMIKLGFLNRIPASSGLARNGCQEPEDSLQEQVRALLGNNCSNDYIFAEKLQKILKQYQEHQKNCKEAKEIEQPMLSELLKREYISLDAEAKDWKEAMRIGGEILRSHGVISEAYIEASIQNVMDSGPYIVLTKGVAIPHAGKKYGVYHTAFSFVRLKTPVYFGNKENDPVKYIFTLATVDSSSHLTALRDLVALFDYPEFFAALDTAKTPDNIIDFIQKFEKQKEHS